MQSTQSILDLEIEDWRGTTGAVHSTAGTTGYFDEASFGNGSQPRSSPADSPMISMSVTSPFINDSYQKQEHYNPVHHHLHIASLHQHSNTHNHHQQQQDAVSTHHHVHNHGQNHYDMDVDCAYHNSYSNSSYGQQHQIHSPPFSPQRHIHGNVGQHEVAAVCDPRFVSGHHDFFPPSQPHASMNGASGTAQHQSTTPSHLVSKSSSPANIDHAGAQNPQVKLEGDAEDLVYPPDDSSFPPLQRPQPLTVVIPSPMNTFHDVRLKRKFSSTSDASQSEFFDPSYSLTSAVRVELDDGGIEVVSPTALISPLERTEIDFQDCEGDIEAYSDADGDSEEYDYDYDDPEDSEFVPRSRPSVVRRTSHQHLSSSPQQHSSQQAWLGVSSQPAGRRRAATSPNVAPQTYQPQPSYPWGYSHDTTGSSHFSSDGSGVVRSRSGTTTGMGHAHRYNPYPTGGYSHSYDAPQPIGHSASYDSTASSTSYVDDLTYPNHAAYPSSLELSLPSLRTRRASTSTSTTSTTTPNTPLTPLTPLSTGGGESQVGVHVHGYATRSGGVSHAYSPSTPSLYESSPNGLTGQMGSLSPNGMGGGSKRRSRPSTSLPVPVPVPNLTKKSRGRRVPTVYQSGSAPSANPNKGARTHLCKVPGCGKWFARGEHLKRHVRSIHTWEKPHKCPYPGCGKDFSRHDNLGQHMRVHKDYNPRV